MTDYCTLAEAKAELKAAGTVHDDNLRRYIRQVSKRIDSTMGTPKRPFFAPFYEERQFPANSLRISSYYNTFDMGVNLLELDATALNTLDLTSRVEVYPAYPSPARLLRLTGCCQTWYTVCGSCREPVFVRVTGWWGWHEDYPNAYPQVDLVKTVLGIDAGVTVITVADADGADEDGFTPRFSPGHLLRIGDELLDVIAVNTSTNVLTVKRGVNGTTAAAHDFDTPIRVYRVDDRIRRITARQAALLYTRQGAFQVETLDGVGTISYPQDLLTELKGTLQDFAYA